MTADEAARAEAESIATRWVPAHMTARQGMVDDIAKALVTGRRLVEEAQGETEALKVRLDALGTDLGEAIDERDRLKGELTEARKALKNCAEVMRIQEKRANEQFHLSAEAFMPMWSSAVEVAEVILAATPAGQAPSFDELVSRVGELPTTQLAAAEQAQGEAAPSDDSCLEDSLINRIAEAKSYTLGHVAKLAKRVDALADEVKRLKSRSPGALFAEGWTLGQESLTRLPAPPPPEAAGPRHAFVPYKSHKELCGHPIGLNQICGLLPRDHAVPPIPEGTK